MGIHLKHLNAKQRERRLALGLPGDLKDMSIMNLDQASAYKAELTQEMRAQGLEIQELYEKSFDDMTDFE